MPQAADDTTIDLTLSQVRQFYRHGFLATAKPLTTAEELAHIRDLLDGLFARFDDLPPELALDLGDVKNHPGAQRTPQINNAAQFEPRLLETQYFRNARAMAQHLLGDDAKLHFDHAILKPPHNERATPWHQDLAYGARNNPDADITRFGCNIWMPLQDTGVEGGCMQFIPYSHLGNLRPHHSVGHDPKVHTLETDRYDASKAVACPLKAGCVTIHQPKTLHYTGPNNTDTARHTWILFFGIQPEWK